MSIRQQEFKMKITLSRSQWEMIGRKAGWNKVAQLAKVDPKNCVECGKPRTCQDENDNYYLFCDDCAKKKKAETKRIIDFRKNVPKYRGENGKENDFFHEDL